MPGCPNCGQANPPEGRYCLHCGTALSDAGIESRRIVTVVFSDLVDSTALGEQLDSEAVREVTSIYFAEVRRAVERHGGILEKYIGDAVMAVFGLPRSHEDDALRAARAAAEIAAIPSVLNPTLGRRWGLAIANRTGVNTGEVTAGDPATGLRLATGDTVNTAARLEQAAPPGEVLLGPATYALLRGRARVEATGPLAMKGKAEAMTAYRLLELRDDPDEVRRLDAPMVGRTHELSELTRAVHRTLVEDRCQQVVLLGAAGVGKTRLITEFQTVVGNTANLLRGRCLSYGEGITYWPVGEAVRSLVERGGGPDRGPSAGLRGLLGDADDAPAVGARLDALAGRSRQTYPAVDLAWAFRRLLESLARAGPVVALFDDVHWAEPTFLDMLEYVRDYARGPVLLLCVARPELTDIRPGWGSADRCRLLRLEMLGDAESEELIENLMGSVPVDTAARRRIVAAAGGNPLFVEELIGLLLDRGQLHNSKGRWIASGDLATVPMPPSISALLTARLDELAAHQRVVLERASVIGQVFYRGALSELCPESVRSQIPGTLNQLARSDFIRPDPSGMPEAIPAALEAFRFRHMLIRDAAYTGLLKRTRAELHEGFAGWLERAAAERAHEFDEIAGHHLEQAWRLLLDVAPGDEHGAEVASAAAERLARAGRRAAQREDLPAAENLLERAAELQRDPDERIRLQVDLADVLAQSGDPGRATEVLQEAARAAAALHDPLLRAQVALGELVLATSISDRGLGAINQAADRLMPVFQTASDHRSICRVLYLRALHAFSSMQLAGSVPILRQAASSAEAAGDTHLWEWAVSRLAVAAAHGPTPAAEAATICRDVLARIDGRRSGAARARSALGLVMGLLGQQAEAFTLARSAVTMLEELGEPIAAAGHRQTCGGIALMAGDPAAAERELRPSIDILLAAGNRWALPTNAAELAHAFALQGRPDEASHFLQIAREAMVPTDTDARWRMRVAEALLLADAGRLDEAITVSHEAVALLASADDLKSQGDALLALAETLHRSGRGSEALEAATQALDRYERKGALVLAEHARTLISRWPASAS